MVLFQYRQGDVWVHHTLDEIPNTENLNIHAHTGCELYCFLRGEGYYTVEGNHYLLTPGTILLMRSGEAHMPHIRATGPYERIAVHFPTEYLEGEDPSLTALFDGRPLGVNNCYPPEPSDLDYLRSTLLRLCTPSDASPEKRIRAYLIPVLYELAGRRGQNGDAVLQAARPHDPLVIDVIEYINTHLTDPFSMADLSQRFFFSVSHINKVFRAETGSSVWDYVVVKRLLLARSLLHSGVSAAGAAARSGFSDYSSFFRLYRRRFGLSPTKDKSSNAPR
jgi:AraC-like DNA-binding protein/mannose-6-phosphate isomerase-like protein (cupin superfamily)